MMEIIQSLLNGFLLGGLYAALGIGMSLVFGIMGLTNLAHGDLVILATYLCMALSVHFAGNLWVALLITICFMVGIGFLMQNFLVNKVLDKGAEPPLLITFGVSILLSNVLLLIFGADARAIPNSLKAINLVNTKYFSVSAVYLLDFFAAILIVLALQYIMQHTYLGRSIRATSDDVNAAELMGVNTKRTYVYTMCMAMVISAVVGLLIGMTYVFYPTSGPQYLIIAFGVVVIGGMGSLVGTLVGGIILGLAQLTGSYFFGPGYQMLAGYIVLLIILAIKPEGLLGKALRS
ncbi:MAG: branched-chain amino acid ABC transporter permease [Desulfotomaculales bacterium]